MYTFNPMKKTTALLLLATTGIFTARAQNLITNGGFELPTVTTSTNFSGSYTISGWSGYATGNGITSASGIVHGTASGGLAPVEGSQHLSLNGGSPLPGSYIEQFVSTTNNGLYRLSYEAGFSGNITDEVIQVEAQVFDSSSNLIAEQFTLVPDSALYTDQSITFTTTSASIRIRFTDISGENPYDDAYLDNIRLEAVSVPFPVTVDVANLHVLKITGAAGNVYNINTSTDKTNWTTAASIILSTSPFIWIDQSATSASNYYQVLIQ